MTSLIHIAHLLTAAWAAAGELITAASLLWLLNQTANAIRWTYAAGAFAGRLLWPVIHGVAAVCKLIDWAEVGATVLACLKVLVAAGVTLAQMALPALVRLSAALGKAYACLLVKPAVVAPAIHPLAAMAEELEAMTCKQLQALIGTRRKCRKAELVAMALAY